MNTKTFRLLLILGFVTMCQTSIAQSGFIGMKKEFSFDVLNAPFGNFSFSYKNSYSKRTSFLFDFGLMYKSKEKISGRRDIDVFSPLTTYRGINAGFGFLWNSKYGGMNMPIGYYMGVSFDFYIGKLNNIIPANFLNDRLYWRQYGQYGYSEYYKDNQTNSHKVEFPFLVTCYNFNFFLGKNTYLRKNITLDIFTKLGLGYFSYRPTNFTPFPGRINDYNKTEEPNHFGNPYRGGYTVFDKSENVYYSKRDGFNLMPQFNVLSLQSIIHPNGFNASHNKDLAGDYTYTATNDQKSVYHKLKMIIYPQIKIGYLF